MSEEQSIIVNEKDEIIGYKDRSEIVSSDIYRVTALWLENNLGEALLVQRAFTKKNSPGKWGPAVAGTVEKGETYDSNIIKEAQEEIGLVGCEFQKAEKMRISEKRNYFLQWFYAQVDKKIEEFILEDGAFEQIKWFNGEELKSALEKSPENFVPGLRANPKVLRVFLKQ
ncbi:MAG: NUDIX domain-containing protein [Candidatus Moraniibacteriota bacterium]